MTIEDFIAGAVAESAHMAGAVGTPRGSAEVTVERCATGLLFRVVDPGLGELFRGVLPVRDEQPLLVALLVTRVLLELERAAAEIGAGDPRVKH